MDEIGLVVAAVTVTAGTVGAFWVRTESIRDDIHKWVEEKYMTREAVSLKFGAIEAILTDQNGRMAQQDKKLDAMVNRQNLQLQYLRTINNAVGNRRVHEGNEHDESNET